MDSLRSDKAGSAANYWFARSFHLRAAGESDRSGAAKYKVAPICGAFLLAAARLQSHDGKTPPLSEGKVGRKSEIRMTRLCLIPASVRLRRGKLAQQAKSERTPNLEIRKPKDSPYSEIFRVSAAL